MDIEDTSTEDYGWGTGTAVIKRKDLKVTAEEAKRTKGEVVRAVAFARTCLANNNYKGLRGYFIEIKSQALWGKTRIEDINSWIKIRNASHTALDLLMVYFDQYPHEDNVGLLQRWRQRSLQVKVGALLDLMQKEISKTF